MCVALPLHRPTPEPGIAWPMHTPRSCIAPPLHSPPPKSSPSSPCTQVFFAPHVETSTGILLPDDYVTRAAAAVHAHGGLMVLDCIASGTIWCAAALAPRVIFPSLFHLITA
jgi:hypothetical protein